MKRLAEQNYYELLEVSPHATRKEIQDAFELAKATYGPDSVATYTLFTLAESRELLKKIEEAYYVLIDDENRREYDKWLAGERLIPFERRTTVIEIEATTPNRRAEVLSTGQLSLEITEDMVNGDFLKRMRTDMCIDLQDIARKTKISITHLENIETENFANLPPGVYLKGYLFQYAGYLGLNPEIVVKGFLKRYSKVAKTR